MRTTLASLFIASSLVACATNAREDEKLPDTITDGAADSWASPTSFGNLFRDTWQRGQIDLDNNVKYPAWNFTLSGDAKVTVETRVAPTDEPDLKKTVVYLYQQRDDERTWNRIAATTPGAGFGSLTKDLGEGTYRVIVKGVAATDHGEFMLRRTCTGAGCGEGPQCILGDGEFWEIQDVHNGSLLASGNTELNAQSQLSDTLKAQIIAAVRESAHDDVTTIEGAFDAVDENVINKYTFWDELSGRNLVGIEYGAGDNSYGAVFRGGETSVAAGIHDGFIENCTLPVQACVFGERMGEAAFMPGMKLVDERDMTSPDDEDITAVQESQIMAATQTTKLTDALESTDDGAVTIRSYENADGRKFTEIQWSAGDNPVGAFFKGDSTDVAAENSDGDLQNCTEF
ncbi:MAG TPA: hypothetical protein VGM90_06185 [Kofleriaceae bacterium]|jgi:hypothetical protein